LLSFRYYSVLYVFSLLMLGFRFDSVLCVYAFFYSVLCLFLISVYMLHWLRIQ